jgi:hypothetical protein
LPIADWIKANYFLFLGRFPNCQLSIGNWQLEIANNTMPNLISRIIDPWYPATAIGLEKGIASVVHLERDRSNKYIVRRAATFNIAESIIRPSFEERNIEDPTQLASVLKRARYQRGPGSTKALVSEFAGSDSAHTRVDNGNSHPKRVRAPGGTALENGTGVRARLSKSSRILENDWARIIRVVIGTLR